MIALWTDQLAKHIAWLRQCVTPDGSGWGRSRGQLERLIHNKPHKSGTVKCINGQKQLPFWQLTTFLAISSEDLSGMDEP